MADDRHYVAGDHYQIDDISGLKVRASRTRMQWDGLVTAPAHFSPRHPQDLVVGVKDDQSVAIARPRQANRFTVVGTSVAVPSSPGATSIIVESSVGFSAGNRVQVMLDSGVNFAFVLGSVVGNVLSWSGTGLPSSVGMCGLENSVLNLSSTGG
jgi:hypothetical protein